MKAHFGSLIQVVHLFSQYGLPLIDISTYKADYVRYRIEMINRYKEAFRAPLETFNIIS